MSKPEAAIGFAESLEPQRGVSAQQSDGCWTVAQIVEATQGRLIQGQREALASSISIDSRKLTSGQAFVAIRGASFDGHQFIDSAIAHACACVIVDEQGRSILKPDWKVPVVVVADTTQALGNLARYHRRRLKARVVAITGSCGKTTTKDLIAHLLDDDGSVLKSYGNQNNHIGVPLTLLALRPQHRIAIVEMGTNHPGEIAALGRIAEPDIAVITNVGPAHLEFLGSIEGVMQEKLSLLAALAADGNAILPGDQLDVCLEATRRLPVGARVVSAGTSDRSDLQAVDVQRSANGMVMRLRDLPQQWTVPLSGFHNVENAILAIACAWVMGVPLSVCRSRLATFEATAQRSEIIRCQTITILNDCYNANPLSVARALETLRDMDVRRRIAVVGDMLELGDFAPSAHEAIGRMASQLGIDAVMAIGDYAECVAHGARTARSAVVATFRTVDDLLEQLPRVLEPGDGVLVKGSRKLNLERVTDFLLQKYAPTRGACNK